MSGSVENNDFTAKDLQSDSRNKLLRSILFCVICIGINMLGRFVAGKLGLPLYIDSIGYLLAACLGGYLPGVAVGYVSNLINGIQSFENMYYGLISVVIAFAATYLYERGFFHKIYKILISIVVFALLGGGLGVIITWLLYGADPESGIFFTCFKDLYAEGRLSFYQASFISNVVLDLMDKAVCTLIVIALIYLIPKDIRENLSLRHFKQRPLSNDGVRTALKKNARTVSLRSKIVVILIVTMVSIAAVTGIICYTMYDSTMIENNTEIAEGVANLVVDYVDGDKIDYYMTVGDSDPEYKEIENLMAGVCDSSPGVEYMYIYKIARDGCWVVFDLDRESLKGDDPGDFLPLETGFDEIIDQLLAGEEIEPMVTNDNYGWLLSVYKPIKDSSGKTVCYLGVDVDMKEAKMNERIFITKEFTLFFGFMGIVLAIAIWIADYHLIIPVNTISVEASKFAYNDDEAIGESVERMRELEIKTGDEVEHLYDALTKTIGDTVSYMEDAQRKNEMLSHMQSGLILVLADMVESRDKSTGDHIKKTSAYVQLILDKLRERGDYHADLLTDEYIENVVHSAPLHDVGKIKVSDVILNKPGRLTDEEFEIMKQHTIAGKEIIETVISTVTESGYLDEAKNMATYHHEKWNGKGYPYGLAGEEIPLSARIMAVADVFDALVSRRCYKEPFSFEEAMDIIRKDAGTHFDPTLAQLFIDASDEVRRIAEELE